MRFDDRLQTLLDQPLTSDSARAVSWGQLIDYVAQKGLGPTEAVRTTLFERISDLRNGVAPERRVAVASAIARPGVHADAVTLIAHDAPQVAAQVLPNARLSEAAWLDLIPTLPATSRALLRSRRDLPVAASDLLARYGPSDFALPGLAGEKVATPSATPIQELVDRIEAFQRRKAEAPLPLFPEVLDVAQSFRFECDRDGVMIWVEGVPRGALIGMTIADMAEPGSFGVDGHAAGAFQHRSAFRDARLLVAGQGDASGNWLISGNPTFNEADGRFLGFRGIARRPHSHEHLNPAEPTGETDAASQDAVRQLAHELRTPLNAISGFAAMIEGQMLGPVSAAYQERARVILAESARVSALLEDADMTARLDAGVQPFVESGVCDPVETLSRIHRELEPLAKARTVELRAAIASTVAPILAQEALVHRVFARFLAAVLMLTPERGTVSLKLSGGPEEVILKAAKPDGWSQIEGTAGEDPALVSGYQAMEARFALRLVESLAKSVSGRLMTDNDSVALHLPRAIGTSQLVEDGH